MNTKIYFKQNQRTIPESENIISRHRFLQLSLKTSAAAFFTLNFIGCRQSPEPPVNLKKLSDKNYENITIMGDFFINETPLQNFNIGQALDDYLYGTYHPHPIENMVLELVSIPSSMLAMLYIDHSFTPLAQMNKKERSEIFLKWRNSPSPLQRGIYTMMHALCMTLLSQEEQYSHYTRMTL